MTCHVYSVLKQNPFIIFFYCCVATCMWAVLADILSLSGLWNYEYIASLWIANKKFMLANVVNVAALWCLWNMRNKICFQGDVWIGMKKVLTGIARTLRRWKPMYTAVMEEELTVIIQKIELEASRPLESAGVLYILKHWCCGLWRRVASVCFNRFLSLS